MNHLLLVIAILCTIAGAGAALVGWALTGLSAPAFSDARVFYALFFGMPILALCTFVAAAVLMHYGRTGWASVVGILPAIPVVAWIVYDVTHAP